MNSCATNVMSYMWLNFNFCGAFAYAAEAIMVAHTNHLEVFYFIGRLLNYSSFAGAHYPLLRSVKLSCG